MPAAAISLMTSIDSVRLARSVRAAGVSCGRTAAGAPGRFSATGGVGAADDDVLSALTGLMKSRMVECRGSVNTERPQNDAAKPLGASQSDRVHRDSWVWYTRWHARLGNIRKRSCLQTRLSSGMIARSLT